MLTGIRDNPCGTHGTRSFGCQWHEPLWDVASLVHTGSEKAPHQPDTSHPPHPQAMGLVPYCQLRDEHQDDAAEWGLGSRELRAAGE